MTVTEMELIPSCNACHNYALFLMIPPFQTRKKAKMEFFIEIFKKNKKVSKNHPYKTQFFYGGSVEIKKLQKLRNYFKENLLWTSNY